MRSAIAYHQYQVTLAENISLAMTFGRIERNYIPACYMRMVAPKRRVRLATESYHLNFLFACFLKMKNQLFLFVRISDKSSPSNPTFSISFSWITTLTWWTLYTSPHEPPLCFHISLGTFSFLKYRSNLDNSVLKI